MQRVLLVDDDLSTRRLLSVYFGGLYELSYASRGSEALRLIRNSAVDLALIEYRLPDCNGLDLLAQIKTICATLPVIMVTALGSERVCAAAFRAGVMDYFAKPFDPAELVQRVAAVFPRGATSALLDRSPGRGHSRFFVAAGSPRPLPGTKETGRALPNLETSDQIAVARAVQFIGERYAERLSLNDVATHVGMSRFTLCRKFRIVMKVSFRDYLAHLRLKKATELLKSRQYSVTEIAHMAGFTDLARFDKVFKRASGMSPSARRFLFSLATKGKFAATNY